MKSILVLQFITLVSGIAVSFLGLVFFSDTDILVSQNIVSLSQLAVFPISVYMSSFTLRVKPRFKDVIYNRYLFLTLFTVIIGFFFVNDYQILYVLFVFGLLIGELSGFFRSYLINTSLGRKKAIISNTLSSLIRLITLIVFSFNIKYLYAFLLSGLLSNISRAILLFKNYRENGLSETVSAHSSSINNDIKLSLSFLSYCSRNISILVAFLITSIYPLMYGEEWLVPVSILIFNLSVTYSNVFWTMYEKRIDSFTVKIRVKYMLGVLIIALVSSFITKFIPENLINADSFSMVKQDSFFYVLPSMYAGFTSICSILFYGKRSYALVLLFYFVGFCLLNQYLFIFLSILNSLVMLFVRKGNVNND